MKTRFSCKGIKLATVLLGLVVGLSRLLPAAEYPPEMVILETGKSGETQVVTGDRSEMDQPHGTASTFKVVVAWAALDRGLVKDVEASLEGAEGGGLRDALQKSMNPPFAILAEKLGGEILAGYAESSGLIEGKIPKNWMKDGGQEAAHGAELKTTLRREHAMAVAWMREEAPWNGEAGKKLQEALVWKGEKVDVRAKTGSYGGSLWMTGCTSNKAVTVFMAGPVERRPEMIRAFLSRWGVEPAVP